MLLDTCVWLTQDEQALRFTKEEKVVLLKLLFETMLELIKLTSVKSLAAVVANRDQFF